MAKNWIIELRNDIGWSQAQMAAYLGLNRSLYSLVELREREILGEANIKLLQLYKQVQAALGSEGEEADGNAEESEDLADHCRQKITETRQLLALAKRKLQEAEEKRHKTLRSVRLQPVVQGLVAKEPSPLQGFLGLQAAKAEMRLQKNSLIRLYDLRTEVAALEARLKSYKAGSKES
ncbi:MAG: hypothetical protein WBB45_03525 [Cyclobacteriaceae bacterium]